MKNKMLLSLGTVFASMFVCLPMWTVCAQNPFSVTYTFDEVVGGSGGRSDPTSPPQVESLLFYPIRAVAAEENPWRMGNSPGAANVFSFNGWPLAADSLHFGEIDLNQYYEMRIVATDASSFRIDSILFQASRTGAGPRCYAVRCHIDNYAQNLTASYYGKTQGTILPDNTFEFSANSTSGTRYDYSRIILSEQSATTYVFRIYAWGASSSSGVFRIENVIVNGVVFPSSTPTDSLSQTVDSTSVSDNPLQQDSDSFPTLFDYSWDSLPPPPSDGWQSFFRLFSPQGVDSFSQTLVLPRPYYDAVLNVYHLDGDDIQIQSVDIAIQDTFGKDAAHLFQTAGIALNEVLPYADALAMLRFIPNRNAAMDDTTYYVIQGSFSYVYTATGQSCTNYLYPSRIGVAPLPSCELHYFIPISGEVPLGIHLYNTSDIPAYSLQWIFENNLFSDSITIDTLSAHALYVRDYWPYGNQTYHFQSYESKSLQDPASTAEANLFSLPVFHPLLKDVLLYGNHHDVQSDYLTADSSVFSSSADSVYGNSSAEYIYSSQGEKVTVYEADTLFFDKILSWRDTLIHYTMHPQHIGWNYAQTSISVHSKQQADILSVWRLPDSLPIPLKNIWFTDDYLLHLLDTFSTEHPQEYAVMFQDKGGLSEVVLPVYYTEMTDSICLGETYSANGFELPVHDMAGDYEYRDTLLAANGGDSVVILALNVCDVPAAPGAIYRDSVMVRSGNYLFNISPVPTATFYLWTVLPFDWKIQGTGETVSLNIPYDGSCKISVRAVNRCGQSEESSLDVLLSDLQTTDGNGFSIYPNPTTSDFSLETKGIRGKTTIRITDMNAVLIYSESRILEDGDHIFRFSLADYPSGMYIISIVNEDVGVTRTVLRE